MIRHTRAPKPSLVSCRSERRRAREREGGGGGVFESHLLDVSAKEWLAIASMRRREEKGRKEGRKEGSKGLLAACVASGTKQAVQYGRSRHGGGKKCRQYINFHRKRQMKKDEWSEREEEAKGRERERERERER